MARGDGVTSKKQLFEPGAVLYSKIRPELRKAVLVDFEGLCSADMYPLVSLSIDGDYLLLWLLSPSFTKQVTRHSNRLAMPKVNQAVLADLPVPVPPLEEQGRIARCAAEMLRSIKDLERAFGQRSDVEIRLADSIAGG